MHITGKTLMDVKTTGMANTVQCVSFCSKLSGKILQRLLK